VSKISAKNIQKGDFVRLRLSKYGNGLPPLNGERSWYGEEHPYTTKDWFEVVAPFEGRNSLTVKFSKEKGREYPTRKSLEAWKDMVLEVRREDIVPVYKKQLALF